MEPTISNVLSNQFQKANLILIEDSLQNNGILFVSKIINQELAYGKLPIIVSTIHPPTSIYPGNNNASNVIDIRTKSFFNEKNDIQITDFLVDFDKIFSEIKAKVSQAGAPCIVVIDSLERFLLQSVSLTIIFIEKLKTIIKDKSHLFILHHSEPSEYNYKAPHFSHQNQNQLNTNTGTNANAKSKSFANKSMLESLMNVVITLYPISYLKLWLMPGWFDDEQQKKARIVSKPIDSNFKKSVGSSLYNSNANGLILMEHKKSGGKIKREICEYFFVDNQNQLIKYKFPNSDSSSFHPEHMNQPKAMDELNRDISFNLMLTEKQKADKDNIHLPYLDAQDEPSGTITYQPDTDDDWDEDDPDDDLDF